MRHVFLVLTMFLTALPAFAERLHVSSEEYPPYNTRGADGHPTGVYMDQLKIIMDHVHIDYDTTILPWARAIALAENEPMHCVIAAARTPQREKQFKWVSPIHTDRNVLVALKSRKLGIRSLEDAKDYSVGTQRNDYTETILKSLGFQHIDLSADFDKTLLKLAAGRIDLMPMSDSALKKLPSAEFTETIPLAFQDLGMACHHSVPDSLINRMQAALDKLIADGTQRRIFEKYGLNIHR